MLPSLETRQADGIAVETYKEPMAGVVFSIILVVVSLSLLSSFFSQRYLAIRSWRRLPLVGWLIFAIYIDAWLFISIATVLRYGPGINTSWMMCSTAIFLCLSCYISTKLIYLFLIEKAFVVWGGGKSRLKSKLYIFNSFGILGIFGIIGIFNFVFRITDLTNGKCIIGMQRPVLIPLVSFDFAVNVYLTILFLIPLRKLYSFNSDHAPGNAKLRTLVIRTFIGAVTSTVSCLINIVVMLALDGEPGWVCLMACNIDLLFDAIIVQYVTSRDNSGTQTTVTGDNNQSVTAKRSGVIGTSKGGSVGSSFDPSRSRSDKDSALTEVEEEISMSNLGGPPTEHHSSSTEQIKGAMASERSSGSVEDLDLENQTHVVSPRKDFN